MFGASAARVGNVRNVEKFLHDGGCVSSWLNDDLGCVFIGFWCFFRVSACGCFVGIVFTENT